MKKRNTARYLGILSVIFILGTASNALAEKFAYVDVGRIFDGYEKTKSQDGVLSAAGESRQAERDQKVQEVRRLKDELALLGEENRAEKQSMIDDKIKALQEFDAGAAKDLRKMRDDAVREILKDIDDLIKEIGSAKGYDFVFNERALLFSKDNYDITEEVMTELNTRYKNQQA